MEIDLDRLKRSQVSRPDHHRSEHTSGRRNNPSIWQYDYLVLKTLAEDVTALIHRSRAEIPAEFPLAIDVGCNTSPYRLQLEEIGFRVQTMDIDLSGGADLVGTVEATNLPDQHADLIICTQVLEHCSEPWSAAPELFRILRPNGLLLATVPHVWFYHPHPNDNWRYTPEGLSQLFGLFGFETMSMRLQGGTILSLFQIINFCLFGVLGHAGAPLYAICNILGLNLDQIVTNPLFPINIAILARRPPLLE
ncbi:MAG: class I SAM-dependent methyltransferase [Terrimicrobiaceae bacterium]